MITQKITILLEIKKNNIYIKKGGCLIRSGKERIEIESKSGKEMRGRQTLGDAAVSTYKRLVSKDSLHPSSPDGILSYFISIL